MNDLERMCFDIQQKAKETEIENKKKINQKGFNNGYLFSVYEYLRNNIPEIRDLDITHSIKNGIATYKFFNSEYEYNFITSQRKFIYPEFSPFDSIPSVEKSKAEKIDYYKINTSNNNVYRLTYNFETKEIKEAKIDIKNLENEINAAKEFLKKFIDSDLYQEDIRRNPKKYSELDTVFERKGKEIGNEFVKLFLKNKKFQVISEIFDTKELENKITENLPQNTNYSKYSPHSYSNYSFRNLNGKTLLDYKRIEKSIIYFYLFWNKNTFYLKTYIASTYSKDLKKENIIIIDSIFNEINRDREKLIDKYIQGPISDYTDYFSRKNYQLIESKDIEIEKLENLLQKENNLFENGEEELKKEEDRLENLKYIQNLFK